MAKRLIRAFRVTSSPGASGPVSLINWSAYGSFALPISAAEPPATGSPINLTYLQVPLLATPPSFADPYFAFGSSTLTVSPNSGAAIGQGETLLWCPVDANGGSPTDPTPHPRSEGREQRVLGSDSGDWDLTVGTHWQSGVLRVTKWCSPLNGTSASRTVFNQVHGKIPSTGLPVITVIRKPSPGSSTVEIYNIVRTTPASGSPTQTSASISIPDGERFAYENRIVNGLLTIRIAHPLPAVLVGDVFPYGGTNVMTLHSYQFDETWAGGTNYGKAGNYIQDDLTTHSGGVEVVYVRLNWGHNA